MSLDIECPSCGSMVTAEPEFPGETVVCDSCGEEFEVDAGEFERLKAEKEKDIDDLIEIDLALDGDLDGDL